MKILLITDNHTPTGGAENYFFELKQRLQNDANLEVYSIGFAEKAAQGADYFVLKSAKGNANKLFWQFFLNPSVYLQLRQKIRAFNPDIIHLHNVKQYSASLLKAIAPYRVVQTTHDFSSICPTAQNIHRNGEICATGWRMNCFWQHRVKYHIGIYFLQVCAFLRMRKQLKKIVRHFIAPSPFLLNYLKVNQFCEVHYVPPFKLAPSAPVFTSMHHEQFLFVGNLGKHKGVYLLLAEFALACQKNNQLRLLIAGTGAEQEGMQKRVKELGIEANVLFLGWQKNLDKLYQESIALIFPSTGMESFGMVMTEAMAHARPIIGINHGTSAWLIEHQQTGLLFNPKKTGDLAEQILHLANHPALALQLGKQGFVKLHSMFANDAALQKILEIYRY